jgi:hypothetical protein
MTKTSTTKTVVFQKVIIRLGKNFGLGIKSAGKIESTTQ